MLHEELKKRKQELGLTNEQLSHLSGVPLGTLNKIMNGDTKSPRYHTLAAINKVLFPADTSADTVCEATLNYHASSQHDYTLDDYYSLPDDVRAELIDGHLIYMEAPSLSHQEISLLLASALHHFIRKNHGGCKVFTAPLDVQLDCDEKTVVQPDILVSCKKDTRTKRGIYGAPDMCIEIVSPSSRKLDYGTKMAKYLNAGVREYWIVDLEQERVVCYFFEEEFYPVLFTFHDKVPVRIFEGKLEMDFEDIKKQMDEV